MLTKNEKFNAQKETNDAGYEEFSCYIRLGEDPDFSGKLTEFYPNIKEKSQSYWDMLKQEKIHTQDR